jgi:hypothetical protein
MRCLPLLGVLLVSGCASAGVGLPPEPTVTTTTIAGGTGPMELRTVPDAGGLGYSLTVPPREAWRLMRQVHEDLEIPIGILDDRAMVIGNPRLTLTRRFAGEPLASYFSCGVTGGVAANNYRIEMSLLSTLTPAADGGTRVRTEVTATGRDPFGGNAPVQCASTYGLERKIAAAVAALQRSPAPAGP